MGKPYFENDAAQINVICDIANALKITNPTIKRNTLIDIKNQIKK
jgi:hypothetical protein